MTEGLKQAVEEAAKRAEVITSVAAVYDAVADESASRRPLCEMSGRCCRFEEFGHRLYVTTIELAAFLAGIGARREMSWDGTGCPFQSAKLCTVHAIRPFGCRMFFCDPTSTQWQNDAYERFHARLKSLHEQLSVPYFYVEWRQALRELGLAPSEPLSAQQTSF
jgi:Fe-S-cluster containining protein